jgi:transposase InsO family protein
VWAYDFVHDRTSDGRLFRMLTIIDEYTRECLANVVARRLTSDDVLHVLTDLFVERGPLEHIRSDNGGEFTAKVVRAWLERIVVRTLFIERGSPWENGYNESFNGKLRDELRDREVFYSLREAEVLIERWRRRCNEERRHSALGYTPPAPETLQRGPMPKPRRSGPGGRWEQRPNGVWMLCCRDGANLHWSSTRGTLWYDGMEEARDALRWRVERCLTAVLDGRAQGGGTGPTAGAGVRVEFDSDKLELTLHRRGGVEVVRLGEEENDELAVALGRRMAGSKAGAFAVTPVAPGELSGKPERGR